MTTPKRQLMELTYDGDVTSDVTAFLAAGMGWREIADRLTAQSGTTVSHESARAWYGHLVPGKEAS